MKTLIKILILVFSLCGVFTANALNIAIDGFAPVGGNDVPIWANVNQNVNNPYLDGLHWSNDIDLWVGWSRSVVWFLYSVARDFKTIMYIIAWIYFLVITIKMISAYDAEEEHSKWIKWVFWISAGIIVMQLAFFFVNILYAREIWAWLAASFAESVLVPIIKFLETATSFLFLLMMIWAFYRMITSNWEEEWYKAGKMTVFYAIIWFIVVKFAKAIVYSVYGTVSCNYSGFVVLWWNDNCIDKSQLTWVYAIIVNVINWMNSFVGIIVIIMIMYAGATLLFGGDEEKFKKAKKSIIYIAIWIAILALNYFILTFFIKPEVVI